jgi:hypothetical protein
MNEYRICENCDHHNDVSYLECTNCGADISFIAPSAVSSNHFLDLPEEKPAEVLDERASGEPTLPKDRARPTMIITQIKLVSKIDQFEIRIPLIGCMLGREGDVSPKYFEKNSSRVSRQHLKVYPRGDAYYVVDEKSLNNTYINKQELEKNKDYLLRDGDILRMADMEFLVVKD